MVFFPDLDLSVCLIRTKVKVGFYDLLSDWETTKTSQPISHNTFLGRTVHQLLTASLPIPTYLPSYLQPLAIHRTKIGGVVVKHPTSLTGDLDLTASMSPKSLYKNVWMGQYEHLLPQVPIFCA